MAVLVLICALATTACVGYCLGRRAGTSPTPWRRRTSRVALGKLAMSFVVLVAARRLRRTVHPNRLFRTADLKSVEPVDLLRWGVGLVLRRTSLV
jgi:hypothetical protein